MSDWRPRDIDHLLRRERLLGRMPDQSGHVVWLQAPYGYGKSVLAAHWASRLEAARWRVLWVSAAAEEPRSALARALALPEGARWSLVREAVEERPSAIIIEDLERDAALSPLLRQPPGLVLLASREPLPLPELARLASVGKLLHLEAATLAFTRDEALQLFADAARAEQAWRKSGGWPLLLHLAALTGEVTDKFGPGLLAGMRESLSAAAWGEALLLATIDRLPPEAATEATRALAASGFAQQVDGGVRIHPLLAEMLRLALREEVAEVVRREAPRLPPALRASAFEASGLLVDLAEVLDSDDELGRHDPQAVLRWDTLAPGPRGSCRGNQVGQALCLQGRLDEGIRCLEQAVRDAGGNAEQRLLAAKELVWNLALRDPARARALIDEIAPELDAAPAELAGRFLSDASRVAYLQRDYAAAEAMTRQALAKFPADSPRRLAAQINLGTLRFERAGELDLRIESAREALALAEAWTPEHVSGLHLDLGRLYALLGQRDRMLHHLAQAADGSRSRPWVNLHAEVLLKVAQGEFDAAAAPLARLRAWDNAEAIDGALGGWAWTLIDRGRARDALTLLQGAEGFLACTARALARAACDERVSLDELPPVPEAGERETLLYLAAARWRIGRDVRELDRLLALTSAGARVLPGLVPLSELPRERPQLARAYPLQEVLASGWKEVIAERSAELPPLRITLFGAFRIERDGELLELAPRLRTIVTLLVLGYSRDEVAAALWPELGAQAARNNLHVNLNKLRRTLEPWGVPTYIDEQGLMRASSDLVELRAALRAEDAGAVWLLYRGDLAPGVDLEDVNAEREQIRRQVTQMLLRAAHGAGAQQAEAMLARVLELDPLDEAALQQMLRLLVASGRRARAVEAYERFRQMLGEQIGARPLPATRAALDAQTGDS